MSEYCKKLFLSGAMLLLLANICYALPVRHNRLTVNQPDGSSVTVLFQGDEFFKVTTTTDGAAVTLGDDGYLRYVIYEDGKRQETDYRVSDRNVPSSVISASKNIPFVELQENARERRRAYGELQRPYFMRTAETPVAAAERRLVKAVIILVEFSDVKFTEGDMAKFNALCSEEGYSYNGATGSIKDYFKAQFGDLADFQFDVFGTFTAPKPQSYYGGNDYSGNDAHPDELVAEACKGLDDQIDFSEYDLDGDGVCDFVFMFFAGNDEADNYMLYEDCIWSHAWVIDYYDSNLKLDGVRISSYACTSELRTKGYYGSQFTAIGSFCHEFSHTMGLMDAYDTDYNYDGYPASEALWGVTSLMDSGCYNNDCNTPPNYNAYEREMLGIATPTELQTGKMTIEPINESNRFLRIESDKKDEYFVIEYRKKEGWDAYLPTSGILAYHIDKSDNAAGRSYYYGRSLTAAERWPYNEVNAYPYHQCADLIEAGNSTSTQNTADVFFPGAKKVTMLSTETHDAYKSWSGKEVQYYLDNIEIEPSEDGASFILRDVNAPLVPIVVDYDLTVIGQTATLTWTADFEDPDAVAKVRLSFKDGEEVSVQEPEADSVEFTGLEAGTAYTATIWYEKDGVEGSGYSVDFTTFESRSDFPYIYMDRQALTKGGSMKLRLINLQGDASVEWYFNGQAVADPDNFALDFSGEGILEAHISYPDGREECIMTVITLKN